MQLLRSMGLQATIKCLKSQRSYATLLLFRRVHWHQDHRLLSEGTKGQLGPLQAQLARKQPGTHIAMSPFSNWHQRNLEAKPATPPRVSALWQVSP
mmetsp:Transcript_47813/g.102453  ORF Transcript_47813/g.102453 Transcript_47813/m.102453 type:complete len:96 (+) Transcript_47813:841-1128(+)